MAKKYCIGIDEVGRGPLAGPVVVAAVLLPRGLKLTAGGGRLQLKDSKKLTKLQRERWQRYLCAHPKVRFATARSHPPVIDRLNISRAANAAACRAFLRLMQQGFNASACQVYLDGGLYLGNGRNRLPGRTIVKGDEKINAIKAASIIAKVSRDRAMIRLAKQYPAYGFEMHKGYGTRLHQQALRKYGKTPLHRLTFIKKYRRIKTN